MRPPTHHRLRQLGTDGEGICHQDKVINDGKSYPDGSWFRWNGCSLNQLLNPIHCFRRLSRDFVHIPRPAKDTRGNQTHGQPTRWRLSGIGLVVEQMCWRSRCLKPRPDGNERRCQAMRGRSETQPGELGIFLKTLRKRKLCLDCFRGALNQAQ